MVILKSLNLIFVPSKSARKNPNTSANPQHLDLFPVLSGTLPLPNQCLPTAPLLAQVTSREEDLLSGLMGWAGGWLECRHGGHGLEHGAEVHLLGCFRASPNVVPHPYNPSLWGGGPHNSFHCSNTLPMTLLLWVWGTCGELHFGNEIIFIFVIFGS